MSGSSTPGALGVCGTLGSAVVGGSDAAEPLNVPGARIAAASWLDASGNLWLFGGEGNAEPLLLKPTLVLMGTNGNRVAT